MCISRLFLLIFVISTQLVAQDIVRITPVAFDEASNQWFALLSHCRGQRVWNDFQGRKQPCERIDVAAARILRAESCGYYDLNLARNPYCCRFNNRTCNREYIFYVPVSFSQLEELKCRTRNSHRDDFRWVPADEVMAVADCSCLTLPHCGKAVDVSSGFTNQFKCVWPGFENGFDEYEDHKLVHSYPNYPLVEDAPKSNCTNLSWYRIPGGISFFRKGTSYYEFSPVAECSVRIDGKCWPTIEHYMQAMKFVGQPDVQEQIRRLPYTWQVQEAGEGLYPEIGGEVRSDWDSVKADILLHAYREKLSQYPRLRSRLLCTGGVVLVYDTRTSGKIDRYWGAGRNGAGQNILGQVLMQLRYELKHQVSAPIPFIAQPLANFTNGKYFAPARIIAESCACSCR